MDPITPGTYQEDQPTRAEELTWAIQELLDELPALALGGDSDDEVLVPCRALARLAAALSGAEGGQ